MLDQQQPAAETKPRQFYSPAEAAEIIGVSPMTVYRAIKAGEFPASKFRGRYIVPAQALDDLTRQAMAGDPGHVS